MSSDISMGGINPESSNHQIMVDIQSDILVIRPIIPPVAVKRALMLF